MRHSKIHWESSPETWCHFRTAASLHGHTLCSHETLAFIEKLAGRCTPIRIGLQRGKRRYWEIHGSELDLHRAWWTPPVAPRDAWLLERKQIEDRLQKQSLVSLTDHDSIEAPTSLRILQDCPDLPISVEWTVPFGPTFFHLGIHNLPPQISRELMGAMAEFTASRKTVALGALLQTLATHREVLLVFNHPCWDESGIGQTQHLQWATHFVSQYGEWLHALELNGLRPWQENRMVLRLAHDVQKPIISGGDRHAFEPNTILDLTDAACFSEYVQQVRAGRTDVLLTNQYRETFELRILQSLEEIMQDQEGHGRGWRRWSDRVFYRCDDGVVRSMSSLFADHVPAAIQIFVKGLGLIRHRSVRKTFRYAFPSRQELAL